MSELRASDGDREYAAAALRHHHEAGRLDVDEFDRRLGIVLAARTMPEIGAQFSDLPDVPVSGALVAASASVDPGPPPRVGLPGRAGFAYAATLPARPQKVVANLMVHVSPGLRSAGYDLVEHSDTRLRFAASRIPRWAWALAICVPGPGWLAPILVAREKVDVRFELEDRGIAGTRLTIHGVAPRAIRKALSELVR